MNRQEWYRTVYLQSAHWRKFSKAQLGKRLICEECLRNPATELHHRRYWDARGRSILGKEKASDMTAICRTCHNDIETFKKLAREKKNIPTTITGSVSKTVRRWLSASK